MDVQYRELKRALAQVCSTGCSLHASSEPSFQPLPFQKNWFCRCSMHEKFQFQQRCSEWVIFAISLKKVSPVNETTVFMAYANWITLGCQHDATFSSQVMAMADWGASDACVGRNQLKSCKQTRQDDGRCRSFSQHLHCTENCTCI